MRLPVRLVSALVSAMLFATQAHAAAEDDAIAAIERLHASLIEVAETEPALSLQQRVELLSPVIGETHDLTAMGRLTVRRYWRDMSEMERVEFVDVFERLSITTYASRFASIGPETFEILGAVIDDRYVTVEAIIRRDDGDDVPMDYQLELTGESWRIVHVVADGVSELSLMRSEYSEILDSGGLDDLIVEIESQIGKL